MMMNMLAIVISLACAGFVLLRELLFKHSGQRCRKITNRHRPSLVCRSVHPRNPKFSCRNPIGADWSGQGRTSAPFENRCLYLRGMNLLFH